MNEFRIISKMSLLLALKIPLLSPASRVPNKEGHLQVKL